MQFRLATTKDAAAIKRVQNRVWLSTYPNQVFGISRSLIKKKNIESAKKIDLLSKKLASNYYKAWVCLDNKRVIGFCVAKKTDNLCQINSLCIEKEYQGMGIGKRLIMAALTWLGKDNYITLKVVSYNANAIKFYEKLGFRKISEVKYTPNMLFPKFQMAKKDKINQLKSANVFIHNF